MKLLEVYILEYTCILRYRKYLMTNYNLALTTFHISSSIYMLIYSIYVSKVGKIEQVKKTVIVSSKSTRSAKEKPTIYTLGKIIILNVFRWRGCTATPDRHEL